MASRVRMIAWAQLGQESLVADAVRRGGFELTAVGADDASAVGTLSHALGTEPIRSLREAILHDDAGLLWLASPQRIDENDRRLIRDSNRLTVSSEPLPGSITEMLSNPRETSTARFVPLMQHSPGYRAATEVFEQFGQRHCVNIAVGSGPGQGTLFGRLFDAMDLVQTLCGPVEMVEASLCDPGSSVPEKLDSLRGHLTFNARFSDNRCAAATASDQAGGWFRELTLLGEGGCLRINDDGFEWTAPDGRVLDSHRESKPVSPGGLVAMQIRRLLDNPEATAPPPDDASLLPLCEAARLSCRTGQGEAPRKMLEMLRRP